MFINIRGSHTMFKNYSYSPLPQRHSFEIRGVDVSIINGIRRIILTDIENVGFLGETNPSFDILKNTGPLNNEFLQHRFGLIPLHLTEEEVEAFVEQSLRFEIDVENTGNEKRNVTTHDLKITRDDKQLSEKEVKRIFPVDAISREPILITRLRPKEALHAVGYAEKMTARTHAGYSPVSLCAYKFMVDPAESAKHENVLDKQRNYMQNEFGEPTAIKFDLEVECGLTYKYLVSKAIEILISKISKWTEDLNAITEPVKKGVNFIFEEEDDTLGNILQTFMFHKYIRAKENTPSGNIVSYVGYYCPHPLDTKMVLNIVIKDVDNTDVTPYVEVMRNATKEMVVQLELIKRNWDAFTNTNTQSK